MPTSSHQLWPRSLLSTSLLCFQSWSGSTSARPFLSHLMIPPCLAPNTIRTVMLNAQSPTASHVPTALAQWKCFTSAVCVWNPYRNGSGFAMNARSSSRGRRLWQSKYLPHHCSCFAYVAFTTSVFVLLLFLLLLSFYPLFCAEGSFFSFFTAMLSFSFSHSSHTQAFQRDLSEKFIVIVPNFQYCPKVTCRRTKLPLDACTNPHSCVDYMSEQHTVCLKICLMMALIMACLPS